MLKKHNKVFIFKFYNIKQVELKIDFFNEKFSKIIDIMVFESE